MKSPWALVDNVVKNNKIKRKIKEKKIKQIMAIKNPVLRRLTALELKLDELVDKLDDLEDE